MNSQEPARDNGTEPSPTSSAEGLFASLILDTSIVTLLESVLNNSPTPIYLKDPNGAYLYVNAAWERAADILRSEVLGRTDFDVFPEATAASFHRNDRQAMEATAPLQSAELLTTGGEDRIFASVKLPIVGEGGDVLGLCGISMDITDTLRAEQVRTEERERLAAELHDDALQVMATMGLRLENLEKEAPSRQQERLAELRRMIGDTLQRLRTLTSDMRFADSAGLDLRASLMELLEALESDHSVAFSLEYEVDESPHSLVAVGLYPIAREALTNVTKHSQASHVRVSVTAIDGGIRIAIADNGKGFSETDTRSPEHMGLSSMRSRAHSLGGELNIDSGEGGTQVEVWVPDPGRTDPRNAR